MDAQDELLISFHRQFAENQNHHQRLFIQFVAAVFIVLVGYAIVYTNTGNDANLYTAKRSANGQIVEYSVAHVVEAYFAAQIILCLMIGLVANTGYNFRRDQMVNFRIRRHYLGQPLYASVFPDAFNPQGKSILGYLPGFNFVFAVALGAIQVLLFTSMLVLRGLIVYGQAVFVCIGLEILVYLLPIGVTLWIYLWYWFKYRKKISGVG